MRSRRSKGTLAVVVPPGDGGCATKLRDADYDAWRGPVPALGFSFATPLRSGAVLATLGTPGSWTERASPSDLLDGLVQSASTQALKIAVESPEPTKIASSGSAEREDAPD